MRFSHLIVTLAALGIAMARPVYAEDTVSGPVYTVTHFDVSPTAAPQSAAIIRQYAEARRKDEGNLRFDVLQWEGHPNHFTLVEVWRDRQAFDASVAAAHTKDFRQKVTPLEGALYDERLYQALH